jgi:hypothetical protein
MSHAGPPSHAQLIQMATGHFVSGILYAAAELGLADHLDTPRSATELASGLGAGEESRQRAAP